MNDNLPFIISEPSKDKVLPSETPKLESGT
jgi:hypothetical protein